ncbi:fimbria/pilus periplasmic chaperone [Pseudomonas sp. Fl5BN2]|uniref:fimbrial biogenesis chaperone n=1 Tax=Pseudomonas sp. Fl5BN2 TaxID=2697652 RepID=UPI0013782DE7|nr:fimbria/pilus periplasmic chaperone [Pseudomonas sp. Fl5BN2]NBF03872.1 fimbria/pilus periplasmic chaperone [Pseudomonas sp. Fl5BN2]
MPRRFSFLLCFCCSLALLPPMAQANVVVSGTRIIYPAQEREVSLGLSNKGGQPALVQVWIDEGNPDSKPDDVDVPFVVMPPMARINQGKGQTLRIAYIPQSGVPQDRESVYWLNLLDVPPLASGPVSNHMQLAFRTRLKLFFRPAQLSGSVMDAAEKLRWSLVKSGAETVLRVRNDSAFHVSFNSVDVKLKSGPSLSAQSRMLAPKSSADFTLGQAPSPPGGQGSVVYEWINDYGTAVRRETSLEP